MDLLGSITRKIKSSKSNWYDIAEALGVREIEILKIKSKPNSVHELVCSVTHKVWQEIFNYMDITKEFVGLKIDDNHDHTEISNISKLADILAIRSTNHNISKPNETELTEVKIVHEISQRVSQWKVFGRILGLEESFINQLAIDSISCYERNDKMMRKFCFPKEVNASWKFWRPYLEQFEDGQLVIEEMETSFLDLLVQTTNDLAHIVVTDAQFYVGHPYRHENQSSYSVKKDNAMLCVRIGSQDFKGHDYQQFIEWVETQDRYMDIYTMLKDLKAINFIDGSERFCPLLNTLRDYLIGTNDSGFVVKGYNFANHYCIFQQSAFPREFFDGTYFCYIANDNIALFITKCTKGKMYALKRSIRYINVAGVLHTELQTYEIIKVNVIINNDDDENEYSKFCKQCVVNNLYVSENTFLDSDKFSQWYKALKIIVEKQIKCANHCEKNISKNKEEICNKLKKDMITYEALETSLLPSFCSWHEDQIEELKKLLLLSPTQFQALHSNDNHMLLRGSYGCGKTLVLQKKFEQIVCNANDKEVVYFICNDQQSDFLHYMKFIKSQFQNKRILVCKSNDLTTTNSLPKLSEILFHIQKAWKNTIVHLIIDEFSASYFKVDEIFRLQELLQCFQNSFIIIALQSMEETIMETQNSDFRPDVGYQFDLLSKETSFVCYNLDYSLRCSSEINKFVKATAEIIESTKVPIGDISDFLDKSKRCLIDNEQGREETISEGDASVVAMYSYNQSDNIGHAVHCGNVDIYFIEQDALNDDDECSTAYLLVLQRILSSASEDNKFVVCTYDKDLYNAVYFFFWKNSITWTHKIDEFLNSEASFFVLLTEYAGVRGYEFSNFIFLLPFGSRFLKYRMIESFTRATTKLYVITDNTEIKEDSMEDQLITKWKELDCVTFTKCIFDQPNNRLRFVENTGEITFDEMQNTSQKFYKTNKYPWNRRPDDFNEAEKNNLHDTTIALQCIANSDDALLLNEFCMLHDIDMYAFQDNNRMSMLHIAASCNAIQIAHVLIESKKINVDCKDDYGNVPLHLAAEKGNIEMVRLLANNGADIHICNDDMTTPFHNGSSAGHVNIVEFLLKNGANVHAKHKLCDDTALHDAAFNGHVDVVKLLIEKCVDINVKNENDDTPLHCAVEEGHVDVVSTLLEFGANVNSKNRDRKTPLDLSKEKFDEVFKLLSDRGFIIENENCSSNEEINEEICSSPRNVVHANFVHSMRFFNKN